jgi:Leu/Phe-tRNA-protein transferase
MKNRIGLVLIIFISILLAGSAFAGTDNAEAIVANTNNALYHLIEVTQEQAYKLIEAGATEDELRELGELMVMRAEKITSGATNALDQLGANYEIYHETVTFECEDFSLSFSVDPIRLVDD